MNTISRWDFWCACCGRKAGFAPRRSARPARRALRSSCLRRRSNWDCGTRSTRCRRSLRQQIFLRKLYDQFGNLGLAAAAYNAGGGRIEKWLSRRGALPKETRAYVKIITGHKAEAWTDEENTVYMPTDLPQKAPCEGVGGLSRQDRTAAAECRPDAFRQRALRKAEGKEAEDRKNATAKKLRVAASSAAGRGAVPKNKCPRCPADRKGSSA